MTTAPADPEKKDEPQQEEFVLTAENYYSDEANAEYMSSTQYGAWMKCPSMAFAKYVSHEFGEEETSLQLLRQLDDVAGWLPHRLLFLLLVLGEFVGFPLGARQHPQRRKFLTRRAERELTEGTR